MINLNIDSLNTNKYLVGTAMILLTIGGRFIIGELSEKQKETLDNSDFRKLFIFCAFFMATRDVLKALLLTILFTLIMIYSDKGKEDDNDDEKDFITENSFIYL